MKPTDQTAAEKALDDILEIDVGSASGRKQAIQIIQAVVASATKHKDKTLLRIFDWAKRNTPYPQCKIEGNALLQDICEDGLGYLPDSHTVHTNEGMICPVCGYNTTNRAAQP